MLRPENTNATFNVGVDLAKNVFQIYILDSSGKVSNKKMTRSQMKKFFANHEPCNIGIEACSSSHYWARTFTEMGHFPFLIQAVRTAAFRSGRNKTDATDAKAICEAMLHHGTTFVNVKSVEMQERGELVGRRERLIQQRTQVINQTRGFLAEHGIVMPKGKNSFAKNFKDIVAENWDTFSGKFQLILQDNFDEYESLTKRIQDLDTYIDEQGKNSEVIQRLTKINGIGVLIATVLLSIVGDATQFANGRAMSNYLGLTPGENSSGGKQKLLGISKRGNVQLRVLLIIGAHAAINGLARRKKGEDGMPHRLSNFEKWILNLVARIGIGKAMVAAANKMVRIAWAVIRKGEEFDPKKAVRVA